MMWGCWRENTEGLSGFVDDMDIGAMGVDQGGDLY